MLSSRNSVSSMYIELYFRDKDSALIEKLTVPDTITSWVADAFAVSSTKAMTIARPATLTVFQPFFVTISLPYSVIRGELVEITVTIFNYLQNNTIVRLLLHSIRNVCLRNVLCRLTLTCW